MTQSTRNAPDGTAKNAVPVAVIGLGAVMPDAKDLQAFWQNIRTGKNSIREVPPNRWRLDDFYNPDRKAPDRTYTKIGAWISDFEFDSLKYRIPPKVAEAMDFVQKWAVESARQALEASGYLEKDFDRNRTAVLIGNAMAGELQYRTNLRIYFPRYLRNLRSTEAFQALPKDQQEQIATQFEGSATFGLPPITEDSMPGELSNVIAGRVANVFGLRGPNYTADAACASSLAALESAMTGLAENRFDMVLTGGTDSSMAPHSFVKFSKIGALSAKLSCPFDERADGFVMGEGCGILLLKKLSDAERDNDNILAVIHGIGSSSDGKGKGITAPNPVGQQLALERAYQNAGIDPASVSMLEAHGTSTIAGDMVEGQLACEFYSTAGAKPGSIAMGSVKSQIGHLKSSAGAASMIKAVLCIHEGVIPASLNFENPNPNIPFEGAPVYVPTQLSEWKSNGHPRIAGVSSFGFGGTNFHAVLGEYRPNGGGSGGSGGNGGNMKVKTTKEQSQKPGDRMLAVGAQDSTTLSEALQIQAKNSPETDPAWPTDEVLSAPQRLVIHYTSPEDREKRAKRAKAALASDDPKIWRALSGQGVYRRAGEPCKVAFLFPGQGSQYVGMLKDLREQEPIVAETFAEADSIMEPILGKPLTDFIYTEDTKETKEALRDTNVCQPAMLAADISLTRVLQKHGIQPDMVAGHSLGEYAALVVSGMLSYQDAMYAVSARAREMSSVKVDDPGKMAAVIAPFEQMMEVIKDIPDLAPANFNSPGQTVIAGGTAAIDEAMRRMKEAGIRAVQLQVSHAFHSHIVAPAMGPLRKLLDKLDFHLPKIPLIANVDAKPYDQTPGTLSANLDRLSKQIASPVRWVESLNTMYDMGARTFVEVGAKRVLTNFVLDVLDDPKVMSVATNHPKLGDWPSVTNALAACAASGGPRTVVESTPEVVTETEIKPAAPAPVAAATCANEIVVSGASVGLPGEDHPLFDDANLDRIFEGKTCIDTIPEKDRQRMSNQRITRLVKDAPGGPAFVVIDNPDEVAQLSGRKGKFDLTEEFGIDPEKVASWDITTQLAVGAGLLALKDAAIPLVMHHHVASTGKKLPIGFKLPEPLADETGIIFASAFPGWDQLIKEVTRRHRDDEYESRIQELKKLASEVGPLHAIHERIEALQKERGERWGLDRKFIFRALNMGHAQLAELIGARGPNIGMNGACASTTQAITIASDWIRSGRCRRVLVVAGDDVTNSNLTPWVVGGLLATGAVTQEAKLEEAALPFDRRRNGMITGMGAVGLVVEDAAEAEKRGMLGLVRLLGSAVANSAFHGTRLNNDHISNTMEKMVSTVEQQHGLKRNEMASEMVFVSHETYTPARGGSSSAEVHALRQTFGSDLDNVVIANTKGFTGHSMAVGVEDSMAIRMLERQEVPPIPNHKVQDPALGQLNLSKGGHYKLRYAMRLSAGFGSQLAMTMTEKIDNPGNRLVDQARQQSWLKEVTGLEDTTLEVVHNTLRVKDKNGTAPMKVEAKPVKVASPQPEPAQEEIPVINIDLSTEALAKVGAIQQKVLSIVSDKTGYPVEMLDLDLDLEADLGIDTVKQAEMFSEVRAAFNIPKQDDLKLSDYPTLNHVIGFAKKNLSLSAEVSEPAPAPVTEEPQPVQEEVATTNIDQSTEALAMVEDIQQKVLSIVSDKTGYPVEMLDLDLDLEADLGIDTVKQAEMFSEVRAAFNIPKQDDLKLSDYPTLNHVIGFAKKNLSLSAEVSEPAPAPVTEEPQPVQEEVATTNIDLSTEALAKVEDIQQKVLSIVSDKTGYPVEMLDLDLDLEADLGIDTVKQAEMFSEVRAAFNIPKQDDLKLSDYPTLNHVIGFAKKNLSLSAEVSEPAPAPVTDEPQPVQEEVAATNIDQSTEAMAKVEDIQQKVLSIVSDKTGYPVEMLDLDLDLEADLGIDTVKQAEMFSEVRATFNIPKQDDLKLSDYPTLNHVIGFARDKMGLQQPPDPDLSAEALAKAEAAPEPVIEEEPPAPVVAAPAIDVDAVQDKVLSIVSEKTGYPVEMLDLDLDLEADLGIDTVKQAEMFSEIRAAYNIPKQDDLKLSDYPTLAKVIQFAKDKIADGAAAAETAPEATEESETEAEDPGPEPITSVTAESESVRFLAPVLVGRPAASECVGTNARVTGRTFIIGDYNGAAETLQSMLKALGGEAIRVSDEGNPDKVAAEVERLAGEGKPSGVWILSALGSPVIPGGSDQNAWKRTLDLRARMPFRVAKVLDSMFAGQRGTFFLAATRMGGHLGLGNGSGSYDPAAGATTGLLKALSREWPETVCKAVDLPKDADAQLIAQTLLAEAGYDRGVCEVGHSHGGRWGVGLSDFVPIDAKEALPGQGCLPKNPVVLVTGGAGDIVGQITNDLVKNCKGTYYLADLTPVPSEDDPDLKALVEDRNGLKMAIAGRLKESGERVTPVKVEQVLRELERKSAALESLRAVRKAGGQAQHVSVDVTDVQAVNAEIKKIVDTHGRLDLILHAAGLEHSQGIGRKKPEAFDKILGVKVDGLNALLAATKNVPVKGLMLFGSVAGRFGNVGQTDYSAANDLMAKTTTYLRRHRPEMQVFTLDYSGWGGRGMATRGSIPDQLAAAGITLIPLEEGACSVRRVFGSSYSGELVVACSLGILADSLRAEGVNLETIRQRLKVEANRFPLLGEVLDWTLADGLRLEVSFDPQQDHYLNDHRIDGTAVLPGVMAVETFAEAANLMHPELAVVSVEDLAFEAPLKLYRDLPRTAIVRLLPTWGKQGRVILATMETTRELVGGRKQTTRHFRARVRLDQDVPLVKGEPPGNGATKDIRREAIYQAYFHGPSFQVLKKVTSDDQGKIAGWMQSGTEQPPMGRAGRLMSQPMFTELAFQAAGIVEANQSQKLGLPAGVRRMKIHRAPEGESGQVTAWVVPERSNGNTQYGIRVVDERGFVLLELDGYRTSPFPNTLPADVQTGLAPKRV